MRSPSFRIYPTLLDSYQRYLNNDVDGLWWQDDGGKWHKNYDESTGEYHFTPEEAEHVMLQNLLDSINRVPFTSEAASRGTAFNALVDYYLNGQLSENVKMSEEDYVVHCECDGFNFTFFKQFVLDAAEYFKGSISQLFVKSDIETDYGLVELYGYIDELNMNKVYDIKTTSRYAFGDFEKSWQKHVYPYCLVNSGMCTDIQSFEYTVFPLKVSDVISGTMYREEYTFNFENSKKAIRNICERFIEFLNNHRDLINNDKLFGK